jgi:hypothetical protein
MNHQVAKATSEGDKCRVEGMQYILLALVYFRGITHFGDLIQMDFLGRNTYFCCNLLLLFNPILGKGFFTIEEVSF